MSPSVRWGIIGCGQVTEVKSGPAFQKARDSSLVAVMRRDRARAEDYARRHGVPRWYDDAQALIDDPEVDAVYVATPPREHAAYALACARAGKPAYVEKPMALDVAECRAMVEAFRARGLPLFVAYYRRALPRFLRVKSLLDEGAIGAMRAVHVELRRAANEAPGGALPWRVIPSIAGGGHFVDLGCHTLDFLDFALGPIAQARGFAVNAAGAYLAEDTVAAAFRFESGVVGSGSWCFAGSRSIDRVTMVGDRGELSFSTFGVEPIVVTRDGAVSEHAAETPSPIQQPMIQSVVDELLGRGRASSTGETAMRTTAVIDAILEDYRRSAALTGAPLRG